MPKPSSTPDSARFLGRLLADSCALVDPPAGSIPISPADLAELLDHDDPGERERLAEVGHAAAELRWKQLVDHADMEPIEIADGATVLPGDRVAFRMRVSEVEDTSPWIVARRGTRMAIVRVDPWDRWAPASSTRGIPLTCSIAARCRLWTPS